MSVQQQTFAPDAATQRLEHFLDNVLRKDLNRVLAERDNCYNAASQCVQLRQLLTDLADLGKVRTITIDVAADEMPESEEANRLANAGETVAHKFTPKDDEEELVGPDGKLPPKRNNLPNISQANRAAFAEMLGYKDDGIDNGKTRTVLHKTVTVCDAQCADPTPLQLLCDVSGNNYFEAEAAPPSSSSELNNSNGGASDAAAALDAMPKHSPNNNNNYHFFMTADIKNPSLIHINIGCGVVVPMTHEEANVFLKKKEQLYRDQSQRLSRESLRVRFRIRLVMEAITRMQDQILERGAKRV